MDFRELDLILMIAFVFFGVLCVYNALRLRRAGKLFNSSVLYPGGVKKEDCLDPEGFMSFMRPRLAVLGGAIILLGGVYALKYFIGIPQIVSYIHFAVTAAVLAWGFWFYHRAAKLYW